MIVLNKDSLIGRRIGALIIDHFLITIISMISFMIDFKRLSVDSNYFSKLLPIAMLIGFVGYLFKDSFKGRSLGKLIFGIYVKEYGNADNPPKYYKLILRNLFVIIWFVEFIIMLTNKEGRRLGDKIAKTQVIGYKSNIVPAIVIAATLTLFLFVPSLVIGVTQMIKNDASYITAVQYIENQKEISTSIGEIQSFGFFPTGSVSYTNGFGTADLSIKVYGTQKSIVVRLYLEKTPGTTWSVKDTKY